MVFYGVAIIRMQRAEFVSGENVDDSGLTLGFGNVDGENSCQTELATDSS